MSMIVNPFVFGSGGGGAFDPSTLGTPAHYFDGSALTGYSTSDPVGSDGNTYGGTAATSTGTNRPTYEASAVNGEAALVFDGGDDRLTRSGISGITDYEFYIICLEVAGNAWGTVVALKDFGIEFRENGDSGIGNLITNISTGVGGSGLLTSWALWDVRVNATSGACDLYRNGLLEGTGTASPPDAPDQVCLGSRASGGAPGKYKIASFLLYNGFSSDRPAVRAALMTKYGL